MVITGARVRSDRFDCDLGWVPLPVAADVWTALSCFNLAPVRDFVQSEERNRHFQEANPFSLE